MRALAATLLFGLGLALVGCFGGGGESGDEVAAAPTETTVAPVSGGSTAPTATPVATSTPDPALPATATAEPDPPELAPTAACTNATGRASAIGGLAVGVAAYADDRANLRADHSIDAARVAQIQGGSDALRAVTLLEGPWCGESYTWWLVRAEQAVLSQDDGSTSDGSR